jgi:DNA-binding GntR family transcriptional regulator
LTRGQSRNRRALRDVAFAKIRELIVSGAIAPGERLIEESLGQRFGMSRNPVRESLKILEREGFVTMNPYRGAVVSRIGRKEAMDIFEIRELLDSFAAAQAASTATPADLGGLREILQLGARAIEKGELAKLGILNGRFHAKVHDMAGNAELSRSLERLRLKVEWMFAGYVATRGEEAWLEHQRLADTIAAGDAEVAGRLSKEHVAKSRLAYLELLDRGDGDDDDGSTRALVVATAST